MKKLVIMLIVLIGLCFTLGHPMFAQEATEATTITEAPATAETPATAEAPIEPEKPTPTQTIIVTITPATYTNLANIAKKFYTEIYQPLCEPPTPATKDPICNENAIPITLLIKNAFTKTNTKSDLETIQKFKEEIKLYPTLASKKKANDAATERANQDATTQAAAAALAAFTALKTTTQNALNTCAEKHPTNATLIQYEAELKALTTAAKQSDLDALAKQITDTCTELDKAAAETAKTQADAHQALTTCESDIATLQKNAASINITQDTTTTYTKSTLTDKATTQELNTTTQTCNEKKEALTNAIKLKNEKDKIAQEKVKGIADEIAELAKQLDALEMTIYGEKDVLVGKATTTFGADKYKTIGYSSARGFTCNIDGSDKTLQISEIQKLTTPPINAWEKCLTEKKSIIEANITLLNNYINTEKAKCKNITYAYKSGTSKNKLTLATEVKDCQEKEAERIKQETATAAAAQLKVNISNIMSNCKDADGNTLTLTGDPKTTAEATAICQTAQAAADKADKIKKANDKLENDKQTFNNNIAKLKAACCTSGSNKCNVAKNSITFNNKTQTVAAAIQSIVQPIQTALSGNIGTDCATKSYAFTYATGAASLVNDMFYTNGQKALEKSITNTKDPESSTSPQNKTAAATLCANIKTLINNMTSNTNTQTLNFTCSN